MSGILDLVDLGENVEAAMKEIANILAAKNELEMDEIKDKVQKPCGSLIRSQMQVSKLPAPITVREKLALGCCNGLIYRTLAIIHQLTGETEQCCAFLGKSLNELNKIEQGCDIFKLETTLQLGAMLLDSNKIKESKKVLTASKELYDKCRERKQEDYLNATDSSFFYFLYFQFLEMMLEATDDPTVDELVNLMHVALLRNYEQYFTALGQYQKMGHYGCLVLKYTLQYNCYKFESWIEHAIDLSPYCCEYKAFAQANLLIAAANALLDHERNELRKVEFGPQKIERINICRYLQGRIALGLAQHLLLILFEVRNRRFIVERSSLSELSDEDKNDMTICTDVIPFEHLPKKITNRNESFEKICTNESEIRKIYEKAKESLGEAASILTENEKLSNEFANIAKKYDMLKQIFEFLA